MKPKTTTLLIKQILFVALLPLLSCDLINTSGENLPDEQTDLEQADLEGYFPIGSDLYWEYELTYSDVDPEDSPNFPSPSHFTTRILDNVEVDQNDYYRIENYFVPGMASTGDPTLLRRNEEEVFVYFQEEEHLFYTFDDPDTLLLHWLYVGGSKENQSDYWNRVYSIDEEEVIIQWSLGKSIGRSPLVWEEHFKEGTGRTKIVIKSQRFGTTIYELTNTNVTGGE